MNARKILLWAIPLLIIPAVLLTLTLQWFLANQGTIYLRRTHIKDIVFDAQHRAWVATQKNGVSVFDGQQWTTYTTKNSGLAGSIVHKLLIDSKGQIWAATNNGLSVFDGQQWTTYTTKNSGLAHNEIGVGMALDPQDRVWLYYLEYRANGLSVFNGQSWATYTTENSGLAHNQVFDIAFDHQNRAWIATKKGLNVFDGETWLTYTPDNSGLADNWVKKIAIDDRNRAWIATTKGINVFDGKSWKTYTNQAGNRFWGTNVIAFDNQNKVWVGMEQGLNILDAGSGEFYLYNPKEEVGNIIFDSLGQVWLVPPRNYACVNPIRVLSKETWQDYADPTLPDRCITVMAPDDAGNLWIGTYEGIKIINPAQVPPSASTGVIAALLTFLEHGGHCILPVIIIGLWLALLLDALTGVGVGIASGIILYVCSSAVFFDWRSPVLNPGFWAMITGIAGGLVGRKLRRRTDDSAALPDQPAGRKKSREITGGVVGALIGAAGCITVLAVASILYFILTFLTMK
ncbi:MAG: hypothetical protein D6768_06780 [Chloroflexi bacterium]|nr:MAG: hypothetical protein D6768_06780 [Chloroflexota bacterium]